MKKSIYVALCLISTGCLGMQNEPDEIEMELIQQKTPKKEVIDALWKHLRGTSTDKTQLYFLRQIFCTPVSGDACCISADSYESPEKPQTPLEYAIKTTQVPSTQLLLHHGANVNRPNERSQLTPLDLALNLLAVQETTSYYFARKLKQIIQLLLLYGAEIKNLETHKRALAIYYERYSNPEILLFDAARYGIKKRVEQALAEEVAVDCINAEMHPREDRYRLLSIWKTKENVKALIAEEERVHVACDTRNQYTSLMCALRCNRTGLVHLLLKHGATVDSATIQVAQVYRNEDLIKVVKQREEPCCVPWCTLGFCVIQ